MTKLSEAMMLGGTTFRMSNDSWNTCLLGVSCRALGQENHHNGEAMLRWPWLEQVFACPFRGGDMFTARNILSYMAADVEHGCMTLEQAVEWVRQNEPAETIEPQELVPEVSPEAILSSQGVE